MPARDKSKRPQPTGKTGLPLISRQFVAPRAFAGKTFDLWSRGGPGRLLKQLSDEAAGGDVTLTPENLADLVDHFSEEPLPESLRNAVTQHLRGTRVRRGGAPGKRKSTRHQVELIMLPGVYAEALKDAETEQTRLRKSGSRRGRYDDPSKLPTASSIACTLVRTWLPTLKDQSDKSLFNLVSKVRKQLSNTDDGDLSR